MPPPKKKVKLEDESESVSSTKLKFDFYNVPCYNLANFLLGKLLVRRIGNDLLKGRIVETECYLGGEDKASHSYGGRRTIGNEPMYMPPGTAYVYMTYGMYHCFNISSAGPGAAVLLRAIQPLEHIDQMMEFREINCKNRSKKFKVEELGNGPSKLCISMSIDNKTCNKLDLCTSSVLWIEEDVDYSNDFEIVVSSRIGIDSVGEEWAKKPLRFYILGNNYVSKRDKQAEGKLIEASSSLCT
ncbi:hypothetical protein RI129_008812 [Pyrocoelia pectoralis]|uniref:DNA-3-methyladenine glycosylase n=1 Tax=Pyrocoelia pectoralis TaxID=417401 RepID=A0AAN7V671_9COLE